MGKRLASGAATTLRRQQQPTLLHPQHHLQRLAQPHHRTAPTPKSGHASRSPPRHHQPIPPLRPPPTTKRRQLGRLHAPHQPTRRTRRALPRTHRQRHHCPAFSPSAKSSPRGTPLLRTGQRIDPRSLAQQQQHLDEPRYRPRHDLHHRPAAAASASAAPPAASTTSAHAPSGTPPPVRRRAPVGRPAGSGPARVVVERAGVRRQARRSTNYRVYRGTAPGG